MEMYKENLLIRSKQSYGIISQNIMKHSYISAIAKALYAYLASLAGSTNTTFMGQDQACHEMGINRNTLLRYMWELKCWQIIQVEQSRGEKSQYALNQYIINHCPEYIMMEQSDFEENILPLLRKLIDSKNK